MTAKENGLLQVYAVHPCDKQSGLGLSSSDVLNDSCYKTLNKSLPSSVVC